MLVMGRENDAIDALANHILDHSHLAIDVVAALGSLHER